MFSTRFSPIRQRIANNTMDTTRKHYMYQPTSPTVEAHLSSNTHKPTMLAKIEAHITAIPPNILTPTVVHDFLQQTRQTKPQHGSHLLLQNRTP